MLNGFTVLLVGESGAAEAEAGAATPAPAMTAASTSAAPSFFIFAPKLSGQSRHLEYSYTFGGPSS